MKWKDQFNYYKFRWRNRDHFSNEPIYNWTYKLSHDIIFHVQIPMHCMFNTILDLICIAMRATETFFLYSDT